MTPLYKRLKLDGTTFYALPGASEDISSSFQNSDKKMYFDKFVLLNLPKRNTENDNEYKAWDFENAFVKSNRSNPTENFGEAVIESLRNYVANYECTIKRSKINNTENFYDSNILSTVTEKVFWKWCKKLNLIDFEPAIPFEQYFSDLVEFERLDNTNDEYLPEILWQERTVVEYDVVDYLTTDEPIFALENYIEIKFNTITNFKANDLIVIVGEDEDFAKNNIVNTKLRVIEVINRDNNTQSIIVDKKISGVNSNPNNYTGKAKLVYTKLVQYVGEIGGTNNVNTTNKSYTEVFALIPDRNGVTPDVLFRTKHDNNYGPSLTFPILPSEYQSEIIGAENFNNPIVNNNNDYPGSYYGQFDTLNYTYTNSNGDELRRNGDYFGVSGTINNTVIDTSNIDGLTIDFNIKHYIKANILGSEVNNFEDFNSVGLNGNPPSDFEFNAIAWFYTVENNNETQTNLYGISFLQNPNNSDDGETFPRYTKKVSNSQQDGTSFSFKLILDFIINNDNLPDLYNPESINSLYSFENYNEAMASLSKTFDSFTKIIQSNNNLNQEITNIKQLLYTQTDINTINSKINNLYNLLKLYSTNQLLSSDTVEVELETVNNLPQLRLNNIDTFYKNIYNINTSDLFNISGIIPYNIPLPTNKNILVNILNNDTDNSVLSDDNVLNVIIERDLDYKQYIDIKIKANDISISNKKLNIIINYKFNQNSAPIQTLLVSNINLPIGYNSVSGILNVQNRIKDLNVEIDYNKEIKINSQYYLEIPLKEKSKLVNNIFKNGDYIILDNLYLTNDNTIDYSNQYQIVNIVTDENDVTYLYLDITTNKSLVEFTKNLSIPLLLNDDSVTDSIYYLSSKPTIKMIKDINIRIIRVIQEENTSINDRYDISIS